MVPVSFKLSWALTHKTETAHKKGCDLDGNAWVPDPTLQPEYLVSLKQFVKVFDMPWGPKWKCQQTAWCKDKKAMGGRGLPLTWQQLRQAEPAGRGGLISSGWKAATQRRANVSVSQEAAAASCFDFASDFQEEMCKRWGPVPGRNTQKG